LVAEWFAQAGVVAAAVVWTCAWELTEQRVRRAEEVPVSRQTVAPLLPSLPTRRHHIRTAAFLAHVSIPLFVQIEGEAISPEVRHRKACATKQGLSCFCGERAKARFSAVLLCALHLVEGLDITSVPARYPQLRGSSPAVRHLSFVPLKWGSDAVISGRHAVRPLETIENFGAVTYGVQAICRAGI
jgi:hypothetical protein